MKWPEMFSVRMREMLGDDYDSFVAAADKPVFRGLRVNTLKINVDSLRSRLSVTTDPSPFCEDSFYIPSDTKSLGNHPLHHAGAFYMQEPSASSAIAVLPIRKGDKILDLCASPGGKSTQIAVRLAGTGLLWSNEYVRSRVSPLISNIERMGIPNAVVSNASPDDLCPKLAACFDAVVVDAPCSGEGMFRKEPQALEQWCLENTLACGERQTRILDKAALCVKGGGHLLYSTCTFSPDENEKVIARFLENHTDFELIPMKADFGVPGYKSFAPGLSSIRYTRHIFPQNGGEGHFVALMRRTGCDSADLPTETPRPTRECEIFNEFFADTFEKMPDDLFPFSVGDKVYLAPVTPKVSCGIVRVGLLAGCVKGNRLEPEHALFATPFVKPKTVLSFSSDDPRMTAFLHGEEIAVDNSFKGYIGVAVDGIPLSFGKASGGRLKNHYPKGLRLL